MEFITEPEFWVAVSFIIFLGVLFYFGVHKKLATILDARAPTIGGRRVRRRTRRGASSRSPPRRPRCLRRRRANRSRSISTAA